MTDGSIDAKIRGGPANIILTMEHRESIKSFIANDCSISLKKIQEKLMENFNLRPSLSTIDRAISSFNFTFKRITNIPERRNDEETIETRCNYSREFLALLSQQDGNNIYFLDEVGFNVSMRAKRGRARRGERAVQVVPNLRSRNLSICCTISKNGTFYYKKQTCPFNTQSYKIYIEELIQKFLDSSISNAILIMDNVPFHRSAEIMNIVLQAGHQIKFLPPYSPFLNPIENMFSQWKQLVRAERPRNEDELILIIDTVFSQISVENCSNYYRHMLDMISRCINKEVITDE